MSDSKLRELERRWRETGSVEDEAAYLRERVRVGDLTQERLELAAYCGHGGAQRAASTHVVAPSVNGDSYMSETDVYPLLSEWTRQLCGYGLEVAVRAGIAAAAATLPTFEAEYPGAGEPRTALHRTEEWVVDQSTERAEAAVAAGLAAEEPVAMVADTLRPAPDQQTVGFGPAYCALTLAGSETLASHGSAQLSDFVSAAVVSVGCAAHVLASEDVVGLVAKELIPWALGFCDPVRERVEARAREAHDG